MPLVAYDCGSDISDSEDEDSNNASAVIVQKPTINNGDNGGVSSVPELSNTRSMFSLLPQPNTNPAPTATQAEDQIEDFIPKAECRPVVQSTKPKIQITVPSLSEFQEDEEPPSAKKTKRNPKNCGLLGILPPAKGKQITVTSLVPKSVSTRQTLQKTKPRLIPTAVKKRPPPAVLPQDSDDEDDVVVPETFDEEMWKKVCGRQEPRKVPLVENIEEPPANENVPATLDSAPKASAPYEGLDNQAFQQLVGRRRPQSVQVREVHEEEILPEKEIWMRKALTDPELVPKPEPEEEEVDPTRRRKHHITYLAQKAKANENEFKNQWAASKYSRNQTRAKYGF